MKETFLDRDFIDEGVCVSEGVSEFEGGLELDIIKVNMTDKIKVCIIGVGFMGEHLMNNFKREYSVIGVDTSGDRLLYLANKYNDIHFQISYNYIEDNDVFIISVPTLVRGENIDISSMYFVRDILREKAKPGSLIMIESSMYVGGTRELFNEFIQRGCFVGFSPGRLDSCRIEPVMEKIPKIISGLNLQSLEKCHKIYSRVFNNLVQVSSSECAEMCKLYENCFRMINIAYVNEISDMCDNLGINTYEMINASSTKPFGFMPFYPSLGVGGHCIPVNPYYLFKNGNLPILKYSTRLMKNRPKNKAIQIAMKYSHIRYILIIGIGFKKDASMLTNSPGYALYNHLVELGMILKTYDPIVQSKNKDLQGIRFLDESEFEIDYLKKMFDLIIVNFKVDSEKNKILKEYKDIGGHVHYI